MEKNLHHLKLKILASRATQAHIAYVSGVSQPTVSRILSGAIKDPKNSVVEKLWSFVDAFFDPAKEGD